MDKYSKIKIMGSHSKASRSMDFSDLQSFSPTQKPNNVTTNKTQEPNHHPHIHKNNTIQHHKGDGDEDEDDDPQTKDDSDSHVVLKRNSSISSSSGFQSAVKGAFSMRRSSSVSERYCRIHDQYSSATSASSPIDDDDEEDQARSMRKTQRGGKILKACKRFLGL